MILLRFRNPWQQQVPEIQKGGLTLADILSVTAQGLSSLPNVQLSQQEGLLSFKLQLVILDTAQTKKEWKPALSKGLQPGFLTERKWPRRS